ncbi:tripartite tricarboxylate transporter substrate binding protein [Roseomonas sp. KE2513]|uniref:Bug family tripartite tricarboxylate transporter substrate binding protein n=1 Tax=Roseomonas sp. KE2513 TaxID=2479202 RepID=UPI0018DF222A|nr:tripartite tricarboxylate transporter substrate binding protein [Roseomonas sp. KE2513]MBI0539484.1 tripartite tricarboxylate transporter substrate binding protein [Roseomonas sp. KE2513]
MSMNRRALLGAAALSSALPSLAVPALAQGNAAGNWPSRPLRLVVPYPPGGAVDLTGRILAERLQPLLGQSVVVDNRGGAGGNVGADYVARSEKDGYTMMMAPNSLMAANRHLYRRSMPLEPLRDLTGVTRVIAGTVLMVVNSSKPWRSFGDVIEAARRDPGKLTMGSSGSGTMGHITISAISKATGVEITHAPYRGGAPAISDLLAGNIDIMFDAIPELVPYVREGRFRPMAVGSAERITYVPGLGEVPGMGELLPNAGLDMQSWMGVVVPTGMPRPVIERLHGALVRIARSDDFRTRMEPQGYASAWDETLESFNAFMREQDVLWKRLVEASGATLD